MSVLSFNLSSRCIFLLIIKVVLTFIKEHYRSPLLDMCPPHSALVYSNFFKLSIRNWGTDTALADTRSPLQDSSAVTGTSNNIIDFYIWTGPCSAVGVFRLTWRWCWYLNKIDNNDFVVISYHTTVFIIDRRLGKWNTLSLGRKVKARYNYYTVLEPCYQSPYLVWRRRFCKRNIQKEIVTFPITHHNFFS